MIRRRFLFLQGCASPFFTRVGDRLRQEGHRVFRVNFSAGDALQWLGRPAWGFPGPVDQLPDYLEARVQAHGITDLVMLGDTRPVHAAALPVARRHGARLHVLEEGYFRPAWLTVEEGGINGHSRLPRDPHWYREAARLVPHYREGEPVRTTVPLLALHEIAYRVPNLLNPFAYPGYRTHRPHLAAVEFYGWARRFAAMPRHRRRDEAAIDALLRQRRPYYLLPLQLHSDAQIRNHSRFPGIPFVVKRVINSFLRHAPADAALVIKNHPLDTGFIDYGGWLRRLEEKLHAHGRILYLESGGLPRLLNHARGVITVNSTVGTTALGRGVPVIALGNAIYDLPGLTFQGGLDAFWTDAEPSDPALYEAFRDTVIHTTQVNGGFYCRRGMALGSAGCAERIAREVPALQELLQRTHGLAPAADAAWDPAASGDWSTAALDAAG